MKTRLATCKALATSLPGIPKDDDGPVFQEPWQAKAFALTVSLHEQGLFSWTNWGEYLSAEIKEAEIQGRTDTAAAYYSHWMTALEKILCNKKILHDHSLAIRKNDWMVAAANTPHGKPVILEPTPID